MPNNNHNVSFKIDQNENAYYNSKGNVNDDCCNQSYSNDTVHGAHEHDSFCQHDNNALQHRSDMINNFAPRSNNYYDNAMNSDNYYNTNNKFQNSNECQINNSFYDNDW